MKKQVLVLFCSVSLLLFSCTKNQDKVAQVDPQTGKTDNQFKNFPKYPNEIIPIGIQTPDLLKSILNQAKQNGTSIDSSKQNGGGRTLFLSSDEIPALTTQDRTNVFIGGIFYGNSINDMSLRLVAGPGVKRRPISVYADFPTDFISDSIAIPSQVAQKAFLRKALKQGTGEQIASFTFDMQRFYSYNELKLSFGANVNVGKLFSLSISDSITQSTRKTRIRAMFVQKNYTISMDPPADGMLVDGPITPAVYGTYAPLIVSNVNFGRLGVMTIESDSSYDAVNFAVKATFNFGVVGGGAGVTSDQQHLLDAATIKAYIIGADGTDAVKVVDGFAGFRDLILNGGKFSPERPGVPISFNLRYLSDFTPYATTFQLNLPY